jgi:hypothetical protein
MPSGDVHGTHLSGKQSRAALVAVFGAALAEVPLLFGLYPAAHDALCGLLPCPRSDGQRMDLVDHTLDALL